MLRESRYNIFQNMMPKEKRYDPYCTLRVIKRGIKSVKWK